MALASDLWTIRRGVQKAGAMIVLPADLLAFIDELRRQTGLPRSAVLALMAGEYRMRHDPPKRQSSLDQVPYRPPLPQVVDGADHEGQPLTLRELADLDKTALDASEGGD